MNEYTVSAILLAGGSGSRFGGEINKVLLPLRGKTVLACSLDVLLAHPAVGEVVLVYRSADEAEIRKITENYAACGKPIYSVPGGETRQASVREGLRMCTLPYVAVQDGARPNLQPEFLDRCLAALGDCDGAAAAVPAKDTVKITAEDGTVISTTDRSRTWLMQTPQCFRREVFAALHEKYLGRTDLTDDCMLLEQEGLKVRLVMGSYDNIKLTTPGDWKLL